MQGRREGYYYLFPAQAVNYLSQHKGLSVSVSVEQMQDTVAVLTFCSSVCQ